MENKHKCVEVGGLARKQLQVDQCAQGTVTKGHGMETMAEKRQGRDQTLQRLLGHRDL